VGASARSPLYADLRISDIVETMLEGSGAPEETASALPAGVSAPAARLAASRSEFEITAFHDKMRHLTDTEWDILFILQ
jgi:hypothetical protein